MSSNYNKDTSTFARLIQYFPVLHSVYYVKRNCLYFQDLLKSAELSKETKELGNDVINFSKPTTFDAIMDETESSNPIIGFIAQRFKSHFTNVSTPPSTSIISRLPALGLYQKRTYEKNKPTRNGSGSSLLQIQWSKPTGIL